MAKTVPEIVFFIRYKPIDGDFRHVSNPQVIKDGLSASNASGVNNPEGYKTILELFHKCFDSFKNQTPIRVDNQFGDCVVVNMSIMKYTGDPKEIEQFQKWQACQ